MRRLISPEEAQSRLRGLFGGAFDAAMFSPLAGYAVSCLIYVGAVADEQPTTWARPSTVLWQRPWVLENCTSDAERAEWREAASKTSATVQALLDKWNVSVPRKYQDNSRESLRDETWRSLHQHSAMRRRTGVKTSSSLPTWALEPHFADLFDPALTGADLEQALADWIDKHLDPGARLKAHIAHNRNVQAAAVDVTVAPGIVRQLEPGNSSQILKGVIEQWAPHKLHDPVVLAISESARHVYVRDQNVLSSLGVAIDHTNLLPDAILADLAPDGTKFWVVEAVATDGPITEQRKQDLIDWAKAQRINPDDMRFLTAFESRNAGPARKRLKDLAGGTYAWYLDEPGMELVWVSL